MHETFLTKITLTRREIILLMHWASLTRAQLLSLKLRRISIYTQVLARLMVVQSLHLICAAVRSGYVAHPVVEQASVFKAWLSF